MVRDIRVVSDPGTLRVLADPLRLRMLELLREAPMTVTELAERLQVPRTKLYYHIGLLERHALMRVEETRLVNGIAEKRYAPTAFRLSVAKSLLGERGSGRSALDTMLAVMFDEAAAAIQEAVASGLIDLEHSAEDEIRPHRLMIGRRWYRLSDADVAEWRERYGEFLAAFDDRLADDEHALAPAGSDAQLYEWLIGFFPVREPNDGGAS